jgi:hypothetical protein
VPDWGWTVFSASVYIILLAVVGVFRWDEFKAVPSLFKRSEWERP